MHCNVFCTVIITVQGNKKFNISLLFHLLEIKYEVLIANYIIRATNFYFKIHNNALQIDFTNDHYIIPIEIKIKLLKA